MQFFSSTTPVNKELIATISTNPHTISVGNLLTRPVAKYSVKTGIANPTDKTARMAANDSKKSQRLIG